MDIFIPTEQVLTRLLFYSDSKRLCSKPKNIGLVGCFGDNGPLRQYFSVYRDRERDKEEK